MPDLDLDAFAFPDPPPADARPEVIEAIKAQAKAEPMQMTMEGGEEPHAKNVTPARQFLRAVIYGSRTKGQDHIVVFHETPEGPAPLCTCPATRNIAQRPESCWATQDARELLGLPPVTR